MRKNSLLITAKLAFIVFVVFSYVAAAQNAVTGTWKSELSEKDNVKLHLSLERRTADKHKNQHGSSYAIDELQGLTAENARNGRANFRLMREAGTIEFEGNFANGVGSGTFVFNPDMGFAEGLRSRGFDLSKTDKHGEATIEERLFTAAMVNVTTALADGLVASNLGPLDIGDLYKAAIFKITPEFIAEMKASGFPNLKMEDLVKARIFKIDADYVRKVHEMGFDNADFENMVKFRIFKVTPEYLAELKSVGLSDLDSEDVVKFRIFKLDPEFIRAARAEEPNITVQQLVEKKIGVRRK